MKGVKCKNCVHLEDEWCELVVDSPDTDIVRDCRYFSQKTNADRIRAMSDEELAEFLCTDHCVQIRGNNKLCDGTCSSCVEEWLRQPVKDGDGE